jgi:hypothetical protein
VVERYPNVLSAVNLPHFRHGLTTTHARSPHRTRLVPTLTLRRNLLAAELACKRFDEIPSVLFNQVRNFAH